jgi:ATP-binding cassette subfamily B protein
MKRKKFPFYQQLDQMDCGPTCLRMIAKYHGRVIGLEKLRTLSETTRAGSSLKGLSDTAEKIGLRTLAVKIDFIKLEAEVPLPCIVHWDQKHFVVIHGISKTKVQIADPGHGLLTQTKEEFISHWIGQNSDDSVPEGIVLLMEPTPRLMQTEPDDLQEKKGLAFLYQYLFRYKKFIAQLLVGLIAGSLLQAAFPFLTQSIVDIGIQNHDINFIYLILIAQLFLFMGRTGVELIRGWILLHLSARINISLVSDFFIKLMNLPISFFDVQMTGDILQRINDHSRIEKLLTTSSLSVLFSMFNLVIFGAVLAWYDLQIFGIFLLGSILYGLWVSLFLKKRRKLDYQRFNLMSEEKSKVIELITGMQEIKLHNSEKQMRWSWEFLQARLFKVETKNLALEQTQTIGSNVINEVKNILIIVLAAKLVIDGSITLGMMMAITYITGQLNSPIQQLIGFVYTVQDARIAVERLAEIHNRDDEEQDTEGKIVDFESAEDIVLNNVSFRYQGTSKMVLNELSLTIPLNKVTAIVGASGSGKTTLMKMLLKFYTPQTGDIMIGSYSLSNVRQNIWRDRCGVVMQEGYLFNDTIARNIALGEDRIDVEKLHNAVKVANIDDFIRDLPLGLNTKIGREGIGMSTGQKQRMLIARAVYKDPDIIFFDEATSALDAKNERIIMENLNAFFDNRTAIVIAHRLSTVKTADQIVVLEEGSIIEKGTHKELLELKGSYYNLVKNQLELESLNAKD